MTERKRIYPRLVGWSPVTWGQAENWPVLIRCISDWRLKYCIHCWLTFKLWHQNFVQGGSYDIKWSLIYLIYDSWNTIYTQYNLLWDIPAFRYPCLFMQLSNQPTVSKWSRYRRMRHRIQKPALGFTPVHQWRASGATAAQTLLMPL